MNSPQTELHLPDEARHFVLSHHQMRCKCGSIPVIQRLFIGGQQEFRVTCKYYPKMPPQFEIYRCEHDHPTPWMKSSAEAIQHWKVVAALTKV